MNAAGEVHRKAGPERAIVPIGEEVDAGRRPARCGDDIEAAVAVEVGDGRHAALLAADETGRRPAGGRRPVAVIGVQVPVLFVCEDLVDAVAVDIHRRRRARHVVRRRPRPAGQRRSGSGVCRQTRLNREVAGDDIQRG